MKHKHTSYKPQEDHETPYQRARQEWDDYTGSAKAQAANWRVFALLSLGLLTLSVMGNIYLGQKSSVIPFKVTVNESGEVVRVDKVSAADYTPSEAAVKSGLRDFVDNIRSIGTDQIMVRNRLLRSYDFATAKGKKILTDYINQRKPFDLIGKRAVSIDKVTVTKITDNSYQVEWPETEYFLSPGTAKTNKDSSGKILKRYYTGVFTIKTDIPATEKEMMVNPLGIYIDEFHISEK